jgi:AcrR family transcriptional regulator
VTRMSAAQRRELLVEAAIRVMTRDGVARATTRAIAQEAGMPLGVFHYAFRSKQELMAMVVQTISRRSRADMDAAVFSGETIEVMEMVKAGMLAYFNHVVAHPLEHLVTYELTTSALRDPELEEVAKEQYDYYLQDTEQLLTAGAELLNLEVVEDMAIVTRTMFSLMDGLALNYLARGGKDSACDVIDLAADVFSQLAHPRSSS